MYTYLHIHISLTEMRIRLLHDTDGILHFREVNHVRQWGRCGLGTKYTAGYKYRLALK